MAEFGLRSWTLEYEGTAYSVAAARAWADALASQWRTLPPQEWPDALFCLNDTVAFGALMGLRRRGLRVPEDIALVGCDDLPLSAELDVPLTTIAYPVDEMCRRAVGLLLSRTEADDSREPVAPRCLRLDAELVVRESSMRPARLSSAVGKEASDSVAV